MKNLISALLFFVIFLLSFSSIGLCGEVSTTLQEILLTTPPEEEIPVIIQFRNSVNRGKFRSLNKQLRKRGLIQELRQLAALDQASLQNFFQNKNRKKPRSLWIINGMAASITAGEIQSIAARPEVLEVRFDMPLSLSNDTLSASSTIQWNLAMVGADTLWAEGIMGQGVVIASMDTGVDYLHTQLRGSWRGGTNSWFDPHGEHPLLPYDANGHGTQVMGIMAAQNLNSATIGMAPLAQWISIKIFSDAGEARLSDIHAGYQWLLDPDKNPDTDDSPHIVNNSWGYPSTENTCYNEFAPDIQILRDMGIAMVFAAGNLGSGPSSISPANNLGAFSVGAIDEAGWITNTSSNGPSACDAAASYPTAVAPGYLVNTTDRTLGGLFPDSTTLTLGTSFSAPHVSGAMALLLSYDPDLSLDTLETALINSAQDLGLPGDDVVYGNGLIHVADAFTHLTGVTLCTDMDGDGSFIQLACNTDVDCNDADPSIYPGAPEIVLDGIDQDCNNYDLSIVVTKARYNTQKDKLIIHATSARKKKAKLMVDIPGIGTRELKWNASAKRWQKNIRKASRKGLQTDPAAIIAVYGIEGSVEQTLMMK